MTFEAEWRRCAPWIQAALDHAGNTHALADVRAMVEQRDARFWPGDHAALVACVVEHPIKTELLLWLAGGDRHEIEDSLVPAAEAWGRARGCSRSIIVGRPGWGRTLRGQGYRPTAAICMKDMGA